MKVAGGATLKGHFRLGSKVQWNGAILFHESYTKLDPELLRWGSKTKKWQIKANSHGSILEGKSIGSNPFL